MNDVPSSTRFLYLLDQVSPLYKLRRAGRSCIYSFSSRCGTGKYSTPFPPPWKRSSFFPQHQSVRHIRREKMVFHSIIVQIRRDKCCEGKFSSSTKSTRAVETSASFLYAQLQTTILCWLRISSQSVMKLGPILYYLLLYHPLSDLHFIPKAKRIKFLVLNVLSSFSGFCTLYIQFSSFIG